MIIQRCEEVFSSRSQNRQVSHIESASRSRHSRGERTKPEAVVSTEVLPYITATGSRSGQKPCHHEFRQAFGDGLRDCNGESEFWNAEMPYLV